MDNPRIVVLGAGSIGCFAGAGWHDSGLAVTLIGRQWLIDIIATEGVRLTDYTGRDTRIAPAGIAATTDPAVLGQADVVVLCVKCTASQSAAAQIREFAPPGAVVMSLQNGVSNVANLRRWLPLHTVLAGVVPFNVAYLGPGHWHKGTIGDIVVQKHPLSDELAARLSGEPWSIVTADNMLEIAWGKLLLNLNNAINALSGLTLLEELRARHYRRVLTAAIREALATLRAAGIRPARAGPLPPALLPYFVGAPDWFFIHIGLRLQKIDANARSSMADDFANGRRTEIDYLNREVVELATAIGRSAPVNATITRLVRDAELGGRSQWPGAELLRRVSCRE